MTAYLYNVYARWNRGSHSCGFDTKTQARKHAKSLKSAKPRILYIEKREEDSFRYHIIARYKNA